MGASSRTVDGECIQGTDGSAEMLAGQVQIDGRLFEVAFLPYNARLVSERELLRPTNWISWFVHFVWIDGNKVQSRPSSRSYPVLSDLRTKPGCSLSNALGHSCPHPEAQSQGWLRQSRHRSRVHKL